MNVQQINQQKGEENFSANIRRNVIHLFDKYEKMSWRNDLHRQNHTHTHAYTLTYKAHRLKNDSLEGHKIYHFVDLAEMTYIVSFLSLPRADAVMTFKFYKWIVNYF